MIDKARRWSTPLRNSQVLKPLGTKNIIQWRRNPIRRKKKEGISDKVRLTFERTRENELNVQETLTPLEENWMAPSFPKIAKRTSNNYAIAYWSQQTYALFYLYSSKNSNPSARHAKRPAQSNTFSLSVKFLMTPESTISTQIPWRTYLRTSTWIGFCRSWKRPGCTRKYRFGHNPENTTN